MDHAADVAKWNMFSDMPDQQESNLDPFVDGEFNETDDEPKDSRKRGGYSTRDLQNAVMVIKQKKSQSSARLKSKTNRDKQVSVSNLTGKAVPRERSEAEISRLVDQGKSILRNGVDFPNEQTTNPPSKRSAPKKPRHWTKEEDDALRRAIARFGQKQWKKIAEHVPHRNHTQCLQRWSKVLTPGLKKGQWSASEDQVLIKLAMEQHSTAVTKANGKAKIKWGIVSEGIKGRTAKQCRERWVNNLDPSIRKGNWDAEEDQKILELYEKYPQKWSHIARCLPGRTENSVKVRWKTLDRTRKKGDDGSTSTKMKTSPLPHRRKKKQTIDKTIGDILAQTDELGTPETPSIDAVDFDTFKVCSPTLTPTTYEADFAKTLPEIFNESNNDFNLPSNETLELKKEPFDNRHMLQDPSRWLNAQDEPLNMLVKNTLESLSISEKNLTVDMESEFFNHPTAQPARTKAYTSHLPQQELGRFAAPPSLDMKTSSKELLLEPTVMLGSKPSDGSKMSLSFLDDVKSPSVVNDKLLESNRSMNWASQSSLSDLLLGSGDPSLERQSSLQSFGGSNRSLNALKEILNDDTFGGEPNDLPTMAFHH